ncbi:ribosomal RNA processing protein 1 homolog A-like [Centruroides sculpturatus]|uniref:ribosomal RNA processing protein 1 homolog A-like n=1 Tax=Centruroides sculpturatus TaxID=218467 RepID=UPI000C6C9FF1|nr:ribosomal RNA processing protein 1 homolog A-like [Centruroides sculpturatus]
MSEKRIKVTAEVHFAQHLASNQKKIRDRAFKRLQRWLAARSSCENAFEHEDMMKLWKGLFYCMWMSDKPLIQETLADSMSKLIHRFSRIEYTYMFIECFFETMSREWFGLDKFRLEKFMMVRQNF